ncbi:hypothetical protein [Kitasatospora aureofaciens]|uniref:hypothetical protein n=1 Tax=Kitasatospora aureofaciens TaxID=1894 RepID=UPI0033ED81E2
MIDDDPVALKALTYQLQDIDLVPVEIPLAACSTIDDAILRLRAEGCEGAVCDHRLRGSSQVSFDGAQLVSQANLSARIPGVLLSAWTDEDQATSIRRWRYGIPKVLNKRGRRLPEEILDALTLAGIEAAGNRPLERKAFTTTVEIADLSHEAECPTAHVYVEAWDPDTPVVVPLDLFPAGTGDMPPSDLAEQVYIAEVNYYAKDDGDLFFQNLRLASTPPKNWFPA